MTLSVLDLFSVGIGPSSSHTVGPMRAARSFTQHLADEGLIDSVTRVRTELYGSLAATGIGHGTDIAVVLGLAGHDPETVDPDQAVPWVNAAVAEEMLLLQGHHQIAFHSAQDVRFQHGQFLEGHPNGMRMTAYAD